LIKIDQSISRAMNRRLVLNLLRAGGPKSRAEIASVTGLSAATVGFVVGDLLAEAVLIEGQASSGSSGRRPIPVDINYSGRLAVGLKLMNGSIEGVLTDLSTTPMAALTIPVDGGSPEDYIDASAKAVELLASRKVSKAKITGVGVGMPGIIDTSRGLCLRSNRFNWDNVPIAAMIADRVHVPVWVDDDVNSFALAQQLFGLGKHHQTFGVLAIGVGIGCAVVVDGMVHHGASGAAGKLGHTSFDPSGPTCECGRRGCLQSFFSEPVLLKRWREAKGLGPEVTRFDLLKAAEAGDNTSIALLRDAGLGIGHHLAHFCNILDPEVIVAGGEAVTFGDFLFGPMREALESFCLWTPPPITLDWKDDGWARGAAALATRQLFDFEAASGTVRSV
jgi:predicted NBD/HSP70 family sugar kinase